ncbi:MAG: GatB/YqeY domain-containing protein [Alphaproteobacteria bacterium]|nr:GatB/YqeY domain-containing protein [Alphaproteobacteria bacterium]
MTIRGNISKLLKEAMINKDITLTNTLRLILAAVKDKDISARSKSNSEGINETEIISLLQNMIKQRNASIEMYIQGKRDDLVKIEEDEIKIISNFLPEQLSENEINDIITNSIRSSGAKSIKDMGKVINLIKDEYNGKMDFGVVSKIIKAKLLNL